MALAPKLDPKTDLVVMHRLAAREVERTTAKVTRLKRELEVATAAKRMARREMKQLEAALRADLGLAPGEWLCERCGVTRLSKKSPICQPCKDDSAADQ